MTGTVRFRVTAWASAVLVVVLIATSILLVTVVRRDLVRGVDAELGRALDAVEMAIDDQELLAAELAARPDDEWLVQVIEDGAVVAASAAVEGLAPVATSPATVDRPFDLNVPLDDPAYRVVIREVGDRRIIVGRSLDEVRDGIGVVSGALVVGVPVLTLGLAVLVWTLVGRTLRPVEEIRAGVADLGGGEDLHRRVPEPDTNDEIARLAATMNEMLARLEASTERQRTFVADASHELRIPLTRLRTVLEVDGEGADAAGLLTDVEELQDLVDDLLFLARADARALPPRRTLVDLDDLVRREVHRFDNPSVVTELEPVMVEGDVNELSRAVRNVLDNALRHAAEQVRVELRHHDGQAVLSIADDGAGIPAELRSRVFERFTRLDEARTADRGGAGLGLAIVKSVVDRHGGTIDVDDAAPGARFTMRLPAVS